MQLILYFSRFIAWNLSATSRSGKVIRPTEEQPNRRGDEMACQHVGILLNLRGDRWGLCHPLWKWIFEIAPGSFPFCHPFVQASGMERTAGTVNEIADSVFLGLRNRLVVNQFQPVGHLLRGVEFEFPGIENGPRLDYSVPGLDQFRATVDRLDSREDSRTFGLVHRIDLIQQDYIREFDLIHEQIDNAPLVLRPDLLAAIF